MKIDSQSLQSGITIASELVLSDGFMENYQSHLITSGKQVEMSLGSSIASMGKSQKPNLKGMDFLDRLSRKEADAANAKPTPAQWSENLISINQRTKIIPLLEKAISIGINKLSSYPPELTDTLPDKPKFSDECSAAYRRGRDHLISNPQSPRWLALLLFTLARAIGSNSRSGFNSDVWSEGTMFWFQIESAWLSGDGNAVSKLLLDADRKYFRGEVAINLGSSMPTRLAESASIAPQWSLFHPPW